MPHVFFSSIIYHQLCVSPVILVTYRFVDYHYDQFIYVYICSNIFIAVCILINTFLIYDYDAFHILYIRSREINTLIDWLRRLSCRFILQLFFELPKKIKLFMEKYNKRTEGWWRTNCPLRKWKSTRLLNEKNNNSKGNLIFQISGSIKAFKVELPLWEKLIKCT